jgi:acyl-CoA thioester hydrolase
MDADNRSSSAATHRTGVVRSPFRHAVPLQIRFRDTDAMAHINNAVYLTYLEVARTSYWHHVFDIASYNDVDFVLARAEIDFLAPLFVQDQAEVWIRVTEIGRKSFRFAYELHTRDRIAARAETVQVMYDYAAGTSKAITEEQRRAILSFEEPGSVQVRS